MCRIQPVWRLTPDQLYPHSDTMPQRQSLYVEPQDYSEAQLASVTVANRRLETIPPIVPRFSLGSWRKLGSPELGYLVDQLQLVPIDRIKKREFEQYWIVVDKYKRWIQQSGVYPALSGLKRVSGEIVIIDGHHRFEALKSLGRKWIWVWVSPYRLKQVSYRSEPYEESLSWWAAVKDALRDRLPVPQNVQATWAQMRDLDQ